MKVLTFAAASVALAARYPRQAPEAVGDTIESLDAAESKVTRVDAAAVVGFQQNPGKLEWVKATEHFSVGAGQIVLAGDYAQVKEDTARMLVANGRAEIVTADEVQKATAAAAEAEAADTPKAKK